MTLRSLQIGLIHVAVTITLVPINSTLNRVMIKELGISAALVALLATLPYLFSPIQLAIGSFSDRHPIMGFRRTPYILAGLLLCIFGLILSPQAALLLSSSPWTGLGVAALVFGAWGMGFNFATVSYFSLASEVSGEKGRSRTIATMFLMMIISIIITAVVLSRLLDPYSQAALERSFEAVAGVALLLGALGLLGVEKRDHAIHHEERYSIQAMLQAVRSNRQVTLFFWYLILMLTAILGQDVLLEPFAGEAFAMPVQTTTRITSIWGTCSLITLLVAGFLEGKVAKKTIARAGALGGTLAFLMIAASGVANSQSLFYSGVVMLGLATGLATVSNLSLMLDMTVAGRVGLFIGAWGMANAFSRLVGSVLSGVVRDLITRIAGDPVLGYVLVFAIEAALLLSSLIILRAIDVKSFRKLAADDVPVVERVAIASDL